MSQPRLIKPPSGVMNGGIILVIIGVLIVACSLYRNPPSNDTQTITETDTTVAESQQNNEVFGIEYATSVTGLPLCGGISKLTGNAYKISTILRSNCLNRMDLGKNYIAIRTIVNNKRNPGATFNVLCANKTEYVGKTTNVWQVEQGCPPPMYLYTKGNDVHIEYEGVK